MTDQFLENRRWSLTCVKFIVDRVSGRKIHRKTFRRWLKAVGIKAYTKQVTKKQFQLILGAAFVRKESPRLPLTKHLVWDYWVLNHQTLSDYVESAPKLPTSLKEVDEEFRHDELRELIKLYSQCGQYPSERTLRRWFKYLSLTYNKKRTDYRGIEVQRLIDHADKLYFEKINRGVYVANFNKDQRSVAA